MNVLITGASRGLGLEMVRYGMEQGWRLYACCRHPQRADSLLKTAQLANGRVSVHVADLSELATLQALAYELRSDALDMLIHNAGVYGSMAHQFGKVDVTSWRETFMVNTIAPLKLTELLVENLRMGQGRTLAFLSSKMGSMADNTSGGSYIYRSSKAALNAVVKSLSRDLHDDGIKVVALHPGWVKTDMGGPNAEITPRQSVSQMMRHLQALTLADSGRFIDIDGSDIPW